jgi:hypothetical protein
MANETEIARKGYAGILNFWSEADPALQPLKEARLEHSQLQSRPAP